MKTIQVPAELVKAWKKKVGHYRQSADLRRPGSDLAIHLNAKADAYEDILEQIAEKRVRVTKKK